MGRALRGAGPDHVIGIGRGAGRARAMRVPGRRIAAGAAGRRQPLRALGATDTASADLARLGRASALPRRRRMHDDECAVLFTSGATGPAKGVVYRHRQLQAQLDLRSDATYGSPAETGWSRRSRRSRSTARRSGIASAVPDMDVTAPGTLTAAALADAVAAVDATVVFASPAALRNVVATAGELTAAHQRAALAAVRLLLSAGAPVPVALLRAGAGAAAATPSCTPRTG